MNKWSNIVVHCSDSTWGSAAVIRQWHTMPEPQGRGWTDIGYHFVINNGRIRENLTINSMDGDISVGRIIDGESWAQDNEIGAHTLGMNSTSIGICLIGVNQFSKAQYDSLIDLLYELCKHFQIPISNIFGHYETPQSHGKTCPNIDMVNFRKILEYEFYKKDTGKI